MLTHPPCPPPGQEPHGSAPADGANQRYHGNVEKRGEENGPVLLPGCAAAALPSPEPSRAGQVQAALGSEEERGGAFGRLLERRAEGKGSKRVADLLDEGFRGPLIVLQPFPVRRGARALPSPPSCGFFARTAAMPLCERRVPGEEGD